MEIARIVGYNRSHVTNILSGTYRKGTKALYEAELLRERELQVV